ncbi:unnamed protein product [Adineta ricciae]|uniref:DUF5722 domain-containing protein n=1 Tax=Adineta ricciae TaxID=249248 RepID=A0A816C3B2_ADIRI|nr:unnamed protein product [Adineta ricciae]CAF1619478.1 unnamed protein product [Adineta ricciae]
MYLLLFSIFTVNLLAYQFPLGKQGLSDPFNNLDAITFNARYRIFARLQSGLKNYNVFWSDFESSGIPSSTVPYISCPNNYIQVPSNRRQCILDGYHRFRCINNTTISQFDNLFQRDQAANIQSMGVIWSSPAIYRNVGCHGFHSGSSMETRGCVPNNASLDDFEDYINFLAQRYNGLNGYGHLLNFIIWNEVASGGWYDMSPLIETAHPVTDPNQIYLWTSYYAEMLRRAQKALNRHNPNALIYVSLDQMFRSDQSHWNYPANIGAKTMLDGLWTELGLSVNWSIAIHPYQDPDRFIDVDTLNFFNLFTLSNYQALQLISRGIQDYEKRSQYWMAATEQGWPLPPTVGKERHAQIICAAHNIVKTMPNMIGTTHDSFQQVSLDDPYGLVPYEAGLNLVNASMYQTYKAFVSTSPSYWGIRHDHYCCQTWQMGCNGTDLLSLSIIDGVIDGFITNSTTLSGWACLHGSPNAISIFLSTSSITHQQILGQFLAADPCESPVTTRCQSFGMNYRYSIDMRPFQATQGEKLIYMYGRSPLDGSFTMLEHSGTFIIPKP